MYKTRIDTWGLDKNKKESDMRAIVRKRDQRQRQGKPSAFRVRGKAIDFGDIIRYWERRGLSIEDVVAQRTMSATPDAVVECSTPVLSEPSTPREFAIPENVMRCVRNYYQGSFESGTWYSEDPKYLCRSKKDHDDTLTCLGSLYNQSILSCRLFARFEFQEGGRTLIRATASIKKIIQGENPHTLSHLFLLVMRITHLERLEIARAILRQYADLGELIVGGGHPLSRVGRWLASLESSQIQDVLDVCIRSSSDQFEYLLGPMHWTTLSCRLDYATSNSSVLEFGHGESATEKLLASCIEGLGSCDLRTLNCSITVAHQYMGKGDFTASQRLARQIILYSQDVESREDHRYLQSLGFHILAVSQYRLGEMASAEANQRQAIKIRMSGHGMDDGQVRCWLTELEGWVSAAQPRAWRCKFSPSIKMEEQ